MAHKTEVPPLQPTGDDEMQGVLLLPLTADMSYSQGLEQLLKAIFTLMLMLDNEAQ